MSSSHQKNQSRLSKELRAIEFDYMINNDLTFNSNINDNQNLPKKTQKQIIRRNIKKNK